MSEARGVVLLLHGRARDPQEMVAWFDAALSDLPFAAVAPRATDHTWYPKSFLEPQANNRPYLDAAVSAVEREVGAALERGFGSEQIAIAGFSQGACLASTFAATHPRRYGAVAALTGGLAGRPEDWPEHVALDGVPAYFGSSDPDDWVPWERIEASAAAYTRWGARTSVARYAGSPHAILDEQSAQVRDLLTAIATRR